MLNTISPEPGEDSLAVATTKRRRSYPKELKARIVSECQGGERSVASIALEHCINANLVHKWIRLSREDTTPQMLPVMPVSTVNPVQDWCGHIELSVPNGTMRLFGVVEAQNVRALLRALQ